MYTELLCFFRMHLHNVEAKAKASGEESRVGQPEKSSYKYVDQFGFPVPTCCGYLPQNNSWCSDWMVSLHLIC